MGTQFWWFYDVLILVIAAGLLYNAVARGFSRLIFRLAGFVLAFAAGAFGSGALALPAYNMLYRENIIAAVQMECETLDLFGEMETYIRQNAADSELAGFDRSALMENTEGCYTSPVYTEAAAAVLDPQLSAKITPYPQRPLQDFLAQETVYSEPFLSEYAAGNYAAAAAMLEEGCFRPYYTEMVRMALFLLLELVVLIIAGIISSMAGNLEQQMHIRKFNRILAVPVGLVEVFCVIVSLTVAVQLVVMATDNMMLLFNEDTIAKTKLFQLIYENI